jgi:hypothetical protein
MTRAVRAECDARRRTRFAQGACNRRRFEEANDDDDDVDDDDSCIIDADQSRTAAVARSDQHAQRAVIDGDDDDHDDRGAAAIHIVDNRYDYEYIGCVVFDVRCLVVSVDIDDDIDDNNDDLDDDDDVAHGDERRSAHARASRAVRHRRYHFVAVAATLFLFALLFCFDIRVLFSFAARWNDRCAKRNASQSNFRP